MHILHSCSATWRLMQRTMEPYLDAKNRIARPQAGRKGNEHVGCNRQLPPRVEALQREPEGTHSARRPRVGRYRHHPVGHSADRLGQRPSRKVLTAKAPAPAGAFAFWLLLSFIHPHPSAGLLSPSLALEGLSGPIEAHSLGPCRNAFERCM